MLVSLTLAHSTWYLQDVVFPFNRSIFSRICKIHKRNTSDVASSESEIGSASRFQLVGYSPRKSDLKEKKFPSMAVKVAMMIKFPLVPPTHHITGADKNFSFHSVKIRIGFGPGFAKITNSSMSAATASSFLAVYHLLFTYVWI